ncbi:exosome subunit Rrp45 [Schizosaccharomyces japonicus yFS275]|uniref:Exosome complex component RRP45 n=1 Tax=Schizosaccharomyces japonicus (strain yFS275 / FY16936) TaxID=402676 RepID=B6K7V2_SCHJY|nr:exosome subunit Rrp45 [Schizosaccharomyces japonicus yFS275]EEB09606.1 exosome subunit Rrp45 [Schizosaccharomyces japonicus yFS275]
MPKKLETSTNNRDFILEALSNGVRLDGREMHAFRQPVIKFGDKFGEVDVSLGETRVLCHITAQIAKPYPDKPFDGIFTIHTELTPMAHPSLEAGRLSDQEVLISRLIETSVRRSRALDTESLCILSGQKCWSVRATVHFVNHDGNMVDAACLAVVAALCHYRRPDVTVTGEEVVVHSPEERVPVPLSVLHMPICTTFFFFHDGSISVTDATAEEEELSTGTMTITLNKNREICQFFKAGGVPIDQTKIISCAHAAFKNTQEICEQLKQVLAQDLQKRETQYLGGSAENARS